MDSSNFRELIEMGSSRYSTNIAVIRDSREERVKLVCMPDYEALREDRSGSLLPNQGIKQIIETVRDKSKYFLYIQHSQGRD